LQTFQIMYSVQASFLRTIESMEILICYLLSLTVTGWDCNQKKKVTVWIYQKNTFLTTLKRIGSRLRRFFSIFISKHFSLKFELITNRLYQEINFHGMYIQYMVPNLPHKAITTYYTRLFNRQLTKELLFFWINLS
jgi:hypothetical protein